MNNALKKIEDDIGYLRAEIHRERQARDNAIIKLRAELNDRIDAVENSIEPLVQPLNDTMEELYPGE
ncbi:MAG: hypothetical protein ISS78_05545 [Phycisphaerae bacterium]|nr:hypothetical protein [Phycisphaerae bacterium]